METLLIMGFQLPFPQLVSWTAGFRTNHQQIVLVYRSTKAPRWFLGTRSWMTTSNHGDSTNGRKTRGFFAPNKNVLRKTNGEFPYRIHVWIIYPYTFPLECGKMFHLSVFSCHVGKSSTRHGSYGIRKTNGETWSFGIPGMQKDFKLIRVFFFQNCKSQTFAIR